MAEQKTTGTIATEGGAPPKGHFPPFQAETYANQLLWLAIAFCALYLFLSRVGLPRLGEVIEERHRKVASDLDSAAAMKKRADEAGAAYEAALAGARKNAQAIALETRAKLSAETDAKRKELEKELNAKLAAAEQQIGATKVAAMANVEAIAVDTALAIVERLTGRAPPAPSVTSAVKTALKA